MLIKPKRGLQTLREAQTALQADVDAAATSVGLVQALSAAEWLNWVERQDAAMQADASFRQSRETHQSVLERADRLLAALRPHLALEDPSFEAALAAARGLAKAEREASDTAQKMQDALDTLNTELAQREGMHHEQRGKAEHAMKAWRALVKDLLDDKVAPETLHAAFSPLRDLREHEAKRSEAAQRVEAMETDQARFAKEVADLADRYDLPQAETSADTFALLRDRSEVARTAEAQAAHLSELISKACNTLREKRDQLARIGEQIETMGRIFPQATPVDTIDALRDATATAQKVIAGRIELAKRERAVLLEMGAEDMVQARDLLDGATPSALDAEAETTKSDLAEAELELTRSTEERVTADRALACVTGGAEVAALTERKATLELELEEAAVEHLELSLGHRLADEAIRRYRDTHRSEMMAATERCFTMLTQGAYVRLTTQPDGNGETLLAVDGGGAVKRVAEMSKGTRFQLFLALRAAAHEQLVAQGTRLPFFCDDIFETFDEDRTSAACRVMEQIGRTGQAIYLTHHRHVVEIARRVCDTPPVVHDI